MKVREVERPTRSRGDMAGAMAAWCAASFVVFTGCGGQKAAVGGDAVQPADAQVTVAAPDASAAPAQPKVADVSVAASSDVTAPPDVSAPPAAVANKPAEVPPKVPAEVPALAPGSRPYAKPGQPAPEASGAGDASAEQVARRPAMTEASVVPPRPATPSAPPVSPAQAKLIARGEHVAAVSGCATCHLERVAYGVTPRPYAGGFFSEARFGRWRAPNITQDKKTGIGAWTDAEIIGAVREGKRPDGTQLYPIMPFPFFNAMTDEDAKALVAYLRTIPPVENAVEGNTELKMAKVEMPPRERVEPKTKLEQGRYLASLMHCGSCHRKEGPPLEWYGFSTEVSAADLYPPLVHAKAPPYKAPWQPQEIKEVLIEGRDPKAPTVGPMGIYNPSWKHLSDEEVDAVAEYLTQGDAPTPAPTP